MIDLVATLAGFGVGLLGAGVVAHFRFRSLESKLIEIHRAVSPRKVDAGRIDRLADHYRSPDKAPGKGLPTWRRPGGGL